MHFPSSPYFEGQCSPCCFGSHTTSIHCSDGLAQGDQGPQTPTLWSPKLWPISWALPPVATRYCRCFCHWCGSPGLAGRTGLQMSMRTGRQVALKTTYLTGRDDTPLEQHFACHFLFFLPALTAKDDENPENQRRQPPTNDLTLKEQSTGSLISSFPSGRR